METNAIKLNEKIIDCSLNRNFRLRTWLPELFKKDQHFNSLHRQFVPFGNGVY